MDIIISEEEEKDYKITEALVEEAFNEIKHSDHKEHILVEKLRKSDKFLPELSLVARFEDETIGHIMFTKLIVDDGRNKYETLALAPLSVLSKYQKRGAGSKLILEGLKIAREIGYKSVIVLGDDNYYQRFGFRPASSWDIKAPFEVEDKFFMALELEDNGLTGITGTVVYGREFLE